MQIGEIAIEKPDTQLPAETPFHDPIPITSTPAHNTSIVDDPIFSGSMHYWRLERGLWSDILDTVKKMGFDTVCTYVPWSVHEIERGIFDFGTVNPDHDLDAFLTMCHEKGLRVLIRPGPHVNSELNLFGFPKRIIKDPEIQSRTADGTVVIFPSPPRMFPVPSYASKKLYREVAIYFDAVCPIIVKHIQTGCVRAVQVDNEMSFFLRTQPYDQDYSDDSIALYRTYLNEKYLHIDSVNRAYGTRHTAFNDIYPPVDFLAENKEDIPYYMDWMEYKEYYILYGLSTIKAMLRERGITVPLYHNFPGICTKPPFNLIAAEQIVDFVGFDIYYYKEEYDTVKRCIQYLNACSRKPFVPEFSSGFVALPVPIKPIMFEDMRFTTMCAIMHGIKGMNFYMLVERERWVGSPIDRFGNIRKNKFNFYKELNEFLKRIDYQSYSKVNDICLLTNRDYGRLELASSLITPLPTLRNVKPETYVSEDDVGFSDVIQLENERLWDVFYYSLAAMRYSYTFGDTEMSAKQLSGFKIIVVPTFEFMKKRTQQKLVDYAMDGGTLVVGPRIPRLDETMQPCNALAQYLDMPVHRHDTLEIADWAVRDADVFAMSKRDEAQTGLSVQPSSSADSHESNLAYIKAIGKGRIVHFGFLFPHGGGYINDCLKPSADPQHQVHPAMRRLIESVCGSCAVEPQLDIDDLSIDVTTHISDGKKLRFIANTSDRRKTITLDRVFLDAWHGEHIVGPEISIKPFCVRILEEI